MSEQTIKLGGVPILTTEQPKLKLSDVPLLTIVLCKYKSKILSDIFELTKFAYSRNGKFVYLRTVTGMPGLQVMNYFWRDVVDLDATWEVCDMLGPIEESALL